MTRNRASAKAAGTRHEQSVAGYLAKHIHDGIERRAKNGNKDRGDISGLTFAGQRVVVECKNYGGRILPAAWTDEAHIEMANDGSIAGIVVAKRRGVSDPGSQWVLMTLNDLIGLLTGSRPSSDL